MSEKRIRGLWMWLVFVFSAVVAFALGMIIASVAQRGAETKLLSVVAKPLPENEADPAVWGENYPREYERFLMTRDTTGPTKYGGPFPFSHLDRDTLLRVLWAGYGFSIEYNDDRGHMWSLYDLQHTGRRDPARGGKPGPGTCVTCKSSDVPVLMDEMGIAEFYSTPSEELLKKVTHPIGCLDCHDPRTMALRISRPALKEALVSMGVDTARLTRGQMRSLVCAQCHSEYYFQGPGKYLVFPWKYGLRADDMARYYDEIGFSDWTHAISGAPMVKMQHPDYEMFSQGVHAASGVACADCHMPYVSEGGVKITDHYIQSPLKNINNTCSRCHGWDEAQARAIVETIQDRNREMLDRAEVALAEAHRALGAAAEAGVPEEDLAPARQLVREAQLRWDYVSSNNGMGFHAPQEAARLLTAAVDLARQAQARVGR